MQAHIQKWGNSLGLRIPSQLAKRLDLYPGSAVTIEIKDRQMIIQAPKYDLDTMLRSITAENRHHQIFYDKQFGIEE
jgi:antitoxin MazE